MKKEGYSFEVWTLTLLFIGLKLTGYIEWSWWWVLSPIWITFALAIAVLAVGGAALVAEQISKKTK